MGGIVGFVLLTLISYILIVINAPILIIPIFIILTVFLFKPFLKTVRQVKFKFSIQTISVLIVFILGIAGQMAIISPSGIIKNGDLLFWSANGHDGAWHVALMEEMKNGWPFGNPVFAGEKLINYHFFSDILPAIISKYLPISGMDLYFRIFPFICSLLLGVSAYFLTKRLTKNASAPIWATIFTYFAGSFGYIVTYLKNKTIGGESIFWATQPQSAGGNPPQIISDFIILSAIYFYILFVQEKSNKKRGVLFGICVLLLGTLTNFKVYAGVTALLSFGVVGVWELIKNRKIQTLLLTFVSGVLALILYLPNTSGSASFLIFQPWWYIRTMVVEPSRLNWLDLELRRQFYLDRGGIKSILRIIEYEGIAFTIFFFGNLGMRFLGLKNFLKTHPIVKVAIVISLVFPLLFLQKGVASNTSQFLQYLVLLLGILAGIQVSQIPTKIRYFIAPVIILLMIPTQIGLIKEFYSRPAFAKISAAEIEALTYIKENSAKDSVILTPPYDQYLNLGDTTPNIWDWFDTSYVSALSARRTYFDDYEQMDIMGYEWREREKVKKAAFESEDPTVVNQNIKSSGADILYYPKTLEPKINLEGIGLNLMFENDEVKVWKLN